MDPHGWLENQPFSHISVCSVCQCREARQKIDMRQWRPIMSYLWAVFAGPRWGLPTWQNGGFAIPPPQLPAMMQESQQPGSTMTKLRTMQYMISFATANIHSLSMKPDGHASKLYYLQEQMRLFRLNCLGIQEARTEQGVACRSNILRFSSGHRDGHLWDDESWQRLHVWQQGPQTRCRAIPYGTIRVANAMHSQAVQLEVLEMCRGGGDTNHLGHKHRSRRKLEHHQLSSRCRSICHCPILTRDRGKEKID